MKTPQRSSYLASILLMMASLELLPSRVESYAGVIPTNTRSSPAISQTSSPEVREHQEELTTTKVLHQHPWRIALNFGRELGTPIWDTSYGVSGVRFPVVVPCDFDSEGGLTPHSETVSYTSITGGVDKPVEGGSWSIDKAGRNFRCSLNLPEELSKSDVVIPAGSTLELEGQLYSQDYLKGLETAFSEARKEEWKALEELDAIQAVRDAPKKWNQETQRWEYPKLDEPLTSLAAKHWKAFTKGQARRQKQSAKPQNLSVYSGSFPGFDSRVFMTNNGLIKCNNKVVGRWSAEPMNHLK